MKYILQLIIWSISLLSFSQSTVIWSDDFSNPANWTFTNTSQPGTWNWSITTNQAAIPDAGPTLTPFKSPSASNGFAIIDSYGQPGNVNGDGAINAQITNATPIDLTSSPNVLLRFNHEYRWWHGTRGVRVSGDNGVSWTDFELTDSSYYPVNRTSLNTETETFNISSIAGGQSQVLIQFYYNDNDYKEWFWAVDDVEILEQPQNDIEILDAWCKGVQHDGTEYKLIPDNEFDSLYHVGVRIYNAGFSDQINLVFTADFPIMGINITDSIPFLSAGDSVDIDIVTQLILYSGIIHEATYTVTSTLDTLNGPESADNTVLKKIQFTGSFWAEYDVSGLYTYQESELDLSSLGMGSFEGDSSGLYLGNIYHFESWAMPWGVRVNFAEGTVLGSEILVTIRDSALFFSGASSIMDYGIGYVNQWDTAAGYIDIPLGSFPAITPGPICVVAELYDPFYKVYVTDDRTFNQPEFTSFVYTPGDSTFYKDGVSFGIGLLIDPEGLDEYNLNGINVYPNPTDGLITVTNELYKQSELTVYDVIGRKVYCDRMDQEAQIDLSKEKPGVYIVRVRNEDGEMVRRIVVH